MLLLFRCYVLFDSAAAWTAAPQAPLSMEFSRQEYGSGLPFSSPVDLPDPGIDPRSPALQADSSEPQEMGTYLQEKLVIESLNTSRNRASPLLSLAPPCQARSTLLWIYLRPESSLSPGSCKNTEAPRSPRELLKVDGTDYV